MYLRLHPGVVRAAVTDAQPREAGCAADCSTESLQMFLNRGDLDDNVVRAGRDRDVVDAGHLRNVLSQVFPVAGIGLDEEEACHHPMLRSGCGDSVSRRLNLCTSCAARSGPGYRFAVAQVDAQVVCVSVHGHERAFVDIGSGPAVLLLHGIGANLSTWNRVIPGIVDRGYRVIAPDFLGHGASAKPRADYSLGGFANGMRDLLTLLGIDRVTTVGHSFGGGVAMQFAYQFPERTERVVLVGSGGLGLDVHPVLRLLTLPGARFALGAGSSASVRTLGWPAMRLLHRTGWRPAADFVDMISVQEGLRDPAARAAFLHVLRAAVDWRGQVVTMVDRAYLAAEMPMFVIWGAKDTVIPLNHAEQASRVFPNAQVAIFEKSAHFPHRSEPERFIKNVTSFIEETTPADTPRMTWRDILLARAGG